jgi:hypothetical protein
MLAFPGWKSQIHKKQRECAPIQEIDMAGDEQSAVILKFGTISRQL